VAIAGVVKAGVRSGEGWITIEADRIIRKTKYSIIGWLPAKLLGEKVQRAVTERQMKSPWVHVVIRPFVGNHQLPKKEKTRAAKRGSHLRPKS
jgi:hypothetical protein